MDLKKSAYLLQYKCIRCVPKKEEEKEKKKDLDGNCNQLGPGEIISPMSLITVQLSLTMCVLAKFFDSRSDLPADAGCVAISAIKMKTPRMQF